MTHDIGNPEPKPEECMCCSFETVDLTVYKLHAAHLTGLLTEDAWLCYLCSHSMASNANQYPQQYADSEGMKLQCFIGNVILKAIKENK